MGKTELAYYAVVAVIVVMGCYWTFRPTRQAADGSMPRWKKIACAVAVGAFVALWLKLGITGK